MSALKRRLLEFVTRRLYAYQNRRFVVTQVLVDVKRKRLLDFGSELWIDPIRLHSLEIAAFEIAEKKIPGAVAELGVYKGWFARRLNEAFPDRKLYLFDTFGGFPDADIEADRRRGHLKLSEAKIAIRFKDTSPETVLAAMKHPENCVIRAGYFPDTAEGLEERFCLVSIDTDLNKPIYDGLRYFYPRLSPGGYIFVHDYNQEGYPGVKAAVRAFCAEADARYLPLADASGTVVIVK